LLGVARDIRKFGCEDVKVDLRSGTLTARGRRLEARDLPDGRGVQVREVREHVILPK
jgi:hypothetical protein